MRGCVSSIGWSCAGTGWQCLQGTGVPLLPHVHWDHLQIHPWQLYLLHNAGRIDPDPQRAQLSNLCESCSSGKMANLQPKICQLQHGAIKKKKKRHAGQQAKEGTKPNFEFVRGHTPVREF